MAQGSEDLSCLLCNPLGTKTSPASHFHWVNQIRAGGEDTGGQERKEEGPRSNASESWSPKSFVQVRENSELNFLEPQ